ncbi:hypothetical protein LIER_10035 [Lithospermum erythrorhizon]|uniref:Uncharacterized protein n=1 Tax=Lithospermum erythrorhizon TaxID=34254 RepID=A0AAV3PJW0_LITER
MSLHTRKKDFGHEFFNARDAKEGGRGDVEGNRWQHQDSAEYETSNWAKKSLGREGLCVGMGEVGENKRKSRSYKMNEAFVGELGNGQEIFMRAGC